MRACGPVILAIVVCTGAAQAQSEFNGFCIDAGEFRQHVTVLNLEGDALAAAEAMHDAWVIEFKDALAARAGLLNWIYSNDVQYLSRATDPDSCVYDDQQRIYRLWDMSVRQFEEAYFVKLLRIAPDAPDQVTSARRAHLRKRVCDPRTPMLEQIAGINMDVDALTLEAYPAASHDASLLAALHAHDEQLDRLLRRLDDISWTYHDALRAAWDRARVARDSESPDLPELLEKVARIMLNRYEQYPAIRSLNKRTVQQVQAMLPEPAATEFRRRTERQLHPYLFEHDDSSALRLQSLLAHNGLPEEKRRALDALDQSLMAVRHASAGRLDSLYDETISVEFYRSDFRGYMQRWASRNHEYQETPEELAFKAAVEEWRQRERRFNADIAAIMGEPVAEDDIDPEFLLGTIPEVHESFWIAWDPLLSPELSGGEFDRFLARLSPEEEDQKTVLRALYDQLVDTYTSEGSDVRSRFVILHAKSEAYRRLHPEWESSTGPRKEFGWAALDQSWRRRRQEIEAQFRHDISKGLTSSQQDEWDRVDRMLRRRRVLDALQQQPIQRRYFTYLAPFVEVLNLTEHERPLVESAMRDHELRLDAMLRDAETLEVRSAAAHVVAFGENPPPGSREEYSRAIQAYWNLIGKIREAAVQDAAPIAAAMDDANRGRFLDALDRYAFPALVVPSPAELLIGDLDVWDRLTDDERTVAHSIVETASGTGENLRRQIIAANQLWDTPDKAQKRMALYQTLSAEDHNMESAFFGHPAIPMMRQRRELALEACAQIRSLIGEERLESAPLNMRLLLSWWSPPER